MENNGHQFLTEIKELLQLIAGKYVTNHLEDEDQFIAYFEKQEQAIEEIDLLLTNFRGIYEMMEEQERQLVERLKSIMKEREEERLFFHDWGNPLAIFFQQQAVLEELGTALNLEI